jgi:hypothetical protein
MEVILQGILDLDSILSSRKEIPQIDTITSVDFLILLQSPSQCFYRTVCSVTASKEIRALGWLREVGAAWAD